MTIVGSSRAEVPALPFQRVRAGFSHVFPGLHRDKLRFPGDSFLRPSHQKHLVCPVILLDPSAPSSPTPRVPITSDFTLFGTFDFAMAESSKRGFERCIIRRDCRCANSIWSSGSLH
jgi:hypothetical protein